MKQTTLLTFLAINYLFTIHEISVLNKTTSCVSKLLCYFMNKFGKTPVEKVKNVIVSFYDPDEIRRAKEIFHAEVSKLNLEEAPRHKRRLGDNKSSRDADDIADYIQKCDEVGMLSSLPTFVAADLSRVPVAKAEELYICLLLRKYWKQRFRSMMICCIRLNSR